MTETCEGRRAAWFHLPALLKQRMITGVLHSNASNDHVVFDHAHGMINKLEALAGWNWLKKNSFTLVLHLTLK